MKSLEAYLVGVYLGDGNIYQNNRMNRITYSGNLKNEKEFYGKILSKIIEKVFRIKPRLYERERDNSILLIINSKRIIKRNIRLGFVPGNKKAVRIPRIIKENNNLLKNCLAGIGDTDFSISFKKDRKGIYKEPRMELFTYSPLLAKDVSISLKKFGFTFSFERKKRRGFEEFRIRIYGKRNLNKWIKEIGFRNSSKSIKIDFWKKFGYFVPKKSYTYYKYKLSASSSG